MLRQNLPSVRQDNSTQFDVQQRAQYAVEVLRQYLRKNNVNAGEKPAVPKCFLLSYSSSSLDDERLLTKDGPEFSAINYLVR